MARRLGLGSATVRRAKAGLIKVSMTLPAELAWRLCTKAKMMRVGLGEMCADVLQPLVAEDKLPWDRYKMMLPGVSSPSLPVTTGEGLGKDAAATLPVAGDVPPPALDPPSGAGQKGRKTPAETADAIRRRKAG
jgi:hypothetical protein